MLACSRVRTNSGESWLASLGRSGDASYVDTASVHRRGAFDALFAPIHRAFTCLLSSARDLRDAPIHGNVGQLQTDEAVVGFECHFPQRLDYPAGYPLGASIPKRGGRAHIWDALISPDYNPIGEAPSKIKGILKKVGARRRGALVEAMGWAISAVSSSDAGVFFEHCGYRAAVQPF